MPEPSPQTAPLPLVPLPASVRVEAGEGFEITPDTAVVAAPGDPAVERVARHLEEMLRGPADTLPRLRLEGGDAPPGSISLVLRPGMAEEEYELRVAASGIRIAGGSPAGLFYGAQTLRQLLPAGIEHHAALAVVRRLPAVTVADRPRFAWRGAMLDVARHFLPPADVRRFVDLMALHKLNRLHLHLSDDQGWRIEIRSWPELARHGGSTGVGGGPGGHYTQEEFAALVRYAAERFVTVVPEIDMPGHTNAAIASYPVLGGLEEAPALYTGIRVGFSALCVESDTTWAFVDDVVREIVALAPGGYFHLGGDEVEKLTPGQFRGFVERAQGVVRRHGARPIGWGEIAVAPLLPGTIVQHWREDSSGQAAQRGAPLILSPARRVYLDMKYDASTTLGLDWAGVIPVRAAYDWDPGSWLADVPESAVLGVEAPLWSETLEKREDFDYLAFPRLAAVAEVAWTPQEARRWEEFRDRLAGQGARWTALGVNYHRAAGIPWQDPS